jgi:hypothetical protein
MGYGTRDRQWLRRFANGLNMLNWIRRRCSMMVVPAELLVERNGRVFALLDDPEYFEMFWVKWRITPMTADPAKRSDALSESFWRADKACSDTVLRCKKTGQVAGGFWPPTEAMEGERLKLRGAYVPFEVRFFKRPLLWIWLLIVGGNAYRRE